MKTYFNKTWQKDRKLARYLSFLDNLPYQAVLKIYLYYSRTPVSRSVGEF